MNKSLSEIIIKKFKVQNKYLKWTSRENFSNHKKVKNKCNSLVRKSLKEYFQNVSNANSSHSKSFWNAVKPFVSNTPFFYKQSIFDPSPENCLSFSFQLLSRWSINFDCLNIQTFRTSP